jgi:pyruvate dehydrogenase E2 component (dihydrolipoamide acetyltransferase)
MATSIIMPKSEMAMEEGTIVRWLVREGERVAKGQPILEIETDKSTMEVEADASGVLLRIVEPEGRRVRVTEVIGWIGESGESVPAPRSSVVGRGGSPRRIRRPAESGFAQALRRDKPAGPTSDLPDSVHSRVVAATPAARRLARERGVDLHEVAAAAPGRPIKAADISRSPAGSPPGPGDVVVPLTNIRRTTARRMTDAHLAVPAVTLHARADVTGLAGLRERLQREAGLHVTYNDLVLKAVAAALRECPELNAEFHGDRVLRRGRVHLSIAVATDRGLLIPVLRDADRRSLAGLAREARRLAGCARDGAMEAAEMEGGTFTVSNVGRFGITGFTPIVNPPQVAILGVCAVEDELHLCDGRPAVRRRMGLSLTFDHRAMDGVPPSIFIEKLCELLANPTRLEASPPEALPDA